MTPQRWEYLRLTWAYTAHELDDRWAFDQMFHLWRPGSTVPEAVVAWESARPAVTHVHLQEMLDRLGAEGWELVGALVLESTVGPRRGWDPAGYPTNREWTFKRPSPAAGS